MLGVPRPESIEQLLQGREIRAVCGKPGTLVIHECNLMHASPDNIAGQPRSILMFVYNSTKNRRQRPLQGLQPRPHYLANPDTAALTASQEIPADR